MFRYFKEIYIFPHKQGDLKATYLHKDVVMQHKEKKKISQSLDRMMVLILFSTTFITDYRVTYHD